MTSTDSPLSFLLSPTGSPLFTPTRLPSLFSDLSVQRQTNPEGFDANCAAWSDGLTRLAVAGRLGESSMVLKTGGDLLTVLRSEKFGRPTGLGCVIDSMVGSREAVAVKDFRALESGLYEKKSWIRIPSVAEVVRWSLRTVGVLSSPTYDSHGALRDGEILLVKALEDVAGRVTKWLQARPENATLTGRILSRDAFVRIVSEVLGRKLQPEDIEILLLHLSRDRHLLVYNEDTIKLHLPTTNARIQSHDTITKEDVSIAKLKALILSLESQIQPLEIQITQLQSKAATSLKAKNKSSAMAALRSKALATKSLEQRNATLMQVQEVYAQIKSATDQVTIIETLKESTTVLKMLNKKVGGVEAVEDVLDGLKEEMDKTQEVGDVLREPLVEDTVGEGEVEDELEAMEREEQEKVEKAQREERERVEQREAEIVRERLRELEGMKVEEEGQEKKEWYEAQKEDGAVLPTSAPVPVAVNGRTEEKKGVDAEAELAKSVEKLDALNLDHQNETEKANERPDIERVPA